MFQSITFFKTDSSVCMSVPAHGGERPPDLTQQEPSAL